MKAAYLFDFDYTLADSNEGVIQCVNFAFEKLGFGRPNEDRIRKTIGMSLEKTYMVLTNRTIEDEITSFKTFFVEKADIVMSNNTFLFKNVKNKIQELKNNGITIGIVSTKFRYRIEHILGRESLLNYIDLIVGGEDVQKHKPDKEGIEQAISILGLEKRNTIYVGDSIIDAETAQNANIGFIASLTGTTTREEFINKNIIAFINDISELSCSFI